ncbi:PP2D1 protein, partial [Upupa epops]|nr:PP2D1 protein [Upupa epops]
APKNDGCQHILIVCSSCRQAIHPSRLLHHKTSHRALALLGFASPQTRPDSKTLLAQRQKLISKWNKMPQHSETQRQKIDYSFEFLMGNHTPTSRCNPDAVNSPSTLRVNNSLIKALSICQDKNSTWQGVMQDRVIVLDSYGNRSDTCFLGVVDGFYGVTAAETVAAELPILLLDQLARTDSSYEKSKDEQQIMDSFRTVFNATYQERERIFSDKLGKDRSDAYAWVHKAYAKAFWRMDRLLRLGRNEVSKVRWSGCSAVTCLVERIPSEETGGTEEEERRHSEGSTHRLLAETGRGAAGLLHIANTGNAHAVLCKNGKSHCLSEEHSTSNAGERKRILHNGGSISTHEPHGLVEGYLRTTRGLGYHGDPVLKRSVIPVPHTISVRIDDTCQFLILASNGLWEVLDYNEVLALTLTTFTHYLTTYEPVKQNRASLCQCQNSMPLMEDNLKDSKATSSQQDETEILYPSKDVFVSDSKGNFKQSHAAKELLTTASAAVCNPPPQLEEDTKTYPCHCKSKPAGTGPVSSQTLYHSAASYISQQLVKTALAAGSRENITVLIALLNGC